MLQDAVRDSQATHVGILCRRNIEQAVITPAEVISRRRWRVLERLLLQPRISVKGMLLALEFFLVGEFLARCDHFILCLDVRSIRSHRFGVYFAVCGSAKAAPEPVDL